MAAMNNPANAADWTHIEPLLDEAMDALDETDRAAILLRFFENKTLRERRRRPRYVRRRRAKASESGHRTPPRILYQAGRHRGNCRWTCHLITANAVQAAPAGLALTISAAVIGGTTIAATSTATITKAIAMTTLQKTAATFVIAAAVGTPSTRRNRPRGAQPDPRS